VSDEIPVLRLAKIRVLIDTAFEPEDTRRVDTITLVKRLLAERSELLAHVAASKRTLMPLPDRDRHFANPPGTGLHLDSDQLASLKALLDFAIPREPGSPTDWEGVGRRYHESIIGFRNPCTCAEPRLEGDEPAQGCPVHDPEGIRNG
jgi:hypothetical protein